MERGATILGGDHMAQIEEFPKFQYSEFIKTSTQDGQYVIRAESIEDFKAALTQMRQALGLEGSKSGVATEEPPHPGVTRTSGEPGDNGMYCMTCKKPATQRQGVSKKGQPYNAIFCSTEDRSHTKWL
jgi:hypothetical protein